MLKLLSIAAVVSVASVAALAEAASAEEVVLASGTRYEATHVEMKDGNVQFTYPVGTGFATVSLPESRIEAHSLFSLRLARTPSDDPKAQLDLARFALGHGLLAEAQYRFRKAAIMDSALASERDAGLQQVREVEAARLLATAEDEFRRGRYAAAISVAANAAARAGETSPTAVKAVGLKDLATRLLERDHVRIEADAKAKADAVAAAEAQAFTSALEHADKTILSAVAHRNRVAAPGLSTSQAIRELESADVQLREGRRLLANARDAQGAILDEVAKREHDSLAILVANHIDLGDLYRQQGRFEKARERTRMALILDPQSTRALDVQDRIETDLRASLQATPYDPSWDGVTPYYGGTYFSFPVSSYSYGGYGGGYGRCGCAPRTSPFGGSHFSFGGRGWRFYSGW